MEENKSRYHLFLLVSASLLLAKVAVQFSLNNVAQLDTVL